MKTKTRTKPLGTTNSKRTLLECLRLDKGWSQRELGRRCKLSQRSIFAIEQRNPVRAASQRQVLKALGLDWSDRDDYFDPSSGQLSRAAL